MSATHTNNEQPSKPTPLLLRVLRLAFKFQSVVSKNWAARRAYRLWNAPPRHTPPPRESVWLEQATAITLPHKHGAIHLYQWGEGEETILLLHGWSGRGSQMGAFAQPLVAAGYRVIAIDAPGHGQSTGKTTTFVNISDVLFDVAQTCAPVKAVIAHSYGNFALGYALKYSGLQIDKAVTISTPVRPEVMLARFCDALHLNDAVRKIFYSFFNQDFGEDIWQRMDIEKNVAQLKLPSLIIHDQHDSEVPYELSKHLSKVWPDSQLHLTEKLGHRSILRDNAIVDLVVDFINMPAQQTSIEQAPEERASLAD